MEQADEGALIDNLHTPRTPCSTTTRNLATRMRLTQPHKSGPEWISGQSISRTNQFRLCKNVLLQFQEKTLCTHQVNKAGRLTCCTSSHQLKLTQLLHTFTAYSKCTRDFPYRKVGHALAIFAFAWAGTTHDRSKEYRFRFQSYRRAHRCDPHLQLISLCSVLEISACTDTRVSCVPSLALSRARSSQVSFMTLRATFYQCDL